MFFVLKEIAVILLFSILTAGAAGFLLALLPRAVTFRYDLVQIKPLAAIGICTLVIFGESLFLFGAWRVRRQIDRTRQSVEQTVGSATEITQSEFTRLIGEHIPQAGRYIETGDQAAASAGYQVSTYFDTLRRDTSRYMGRRIGWIAGLFAAAALLLWYDAESQRRRSRAYAAYLESDY